MMKTAFDNKVRTMTHISLLIAMNCVSAYIIIPLPFSLSPISLQTLVVNLVAYVLPPRQAFITMVAYICIGLIGIPVFTGGSAGPGKMFGPTGGYIWGYAVAVTLMAYLKGDHYSFRRFALTGICIGLPIINILGCIQLKLITAMPWETALFSGVVPFIPLDIVKCLGAAMLARPLYSIFGGRP